MKRILLACAWTFTGITSILAGGGEKNIVSATLKSATVYRSGAELQHTTKATLSQGNNELIIEGISNQVDMNSLQIGISNNVTIMSSEFSTDYLRPVLKSAIVKRLEDSLDNARKALVKIQVVINTDVDMINMLKANKEIKGTQSGLSVAELMKMMDYYKSKTLELQSEISQYNEKENKLKESIAKIENQIKEEELKNTKTIGKLVLQLYCPVAGSYDFTISYLTPKAYWNPFYDIKVENISKPVVFTYKAKLVQTTGIDWQQVKLALSTSVPAQHNNAPVLKTWFLTYSNPVTELEKQLSGKLAGVTIRSGNSELNDVVVVGYGTTRKEGVADDYKEPIYIVNGAVVTTKEFNKIDKKAIKTIDRLKEGEAAAVYGSRASGGAVVVTLKEGLGDYVSIDDNQLNVVFNIDLPYDVPTNGKEQSVILKDFTIPAIYNYYTVPKLDKEAYLLGEVSDWEGLNLLPGEANIIFEGTYIGKSAINPDLTLDTMNLTLGRDKRVIVTREKMKDFSSIKFLGANKKQTYTYEITVKNNKKEKIQMMLKDQYPLSTNKDIEVELLQSDGASVNTETGVLTWKLELAPGESKKFRISYSAKYPKDRMLNL